MLQANLFEQETKIWERYPPIISAAGIPGQNVNIWDIPHTIRQLAYLTHSHFRYYGKFPSVVAGQIIDEYYGRDESRPILDNFCGSGTTLVEASLRGIPSFGIDVSWLAVMASNVKTQHVDTGKVSALLREIETAYSPIEIDEIHPKEEKWFELSAIAGLKSIQNQLLEMDRTSEVELLICAFLAIIRRTSKAFDAEVRPHINKDKKPRDVLPAFAKKVREMVENQAAYQLYTDGSLKHECFLGGAEAASQSYSAESPALVISHPPYLNAFNYAPVFNLEYHWGEPFEARFVDEIGFFKKEMVAHPATENNVERYFNLLRAAYQETYLMQKPGDVLAIVIGDCTRNKKLIPVLKTVTELVSQVGYAPIATNYRTTHYGTGKYAYNTRADYHDDDSVKKDGILVFRK